MTGTAHLSARDVRVPGAERWTGGGMAECPLGLPAGASLHNTSPTALRQRTCFAAVARPRLPAPG